MNILPLMNNLHTPDWVKDAVFYQIFPDRFARSPRMRHPRGIALKPWGSPPEEQGYQGGDLYGVADKLDYLGQLGVTALYLNPIFASASNHRYHTFDYYQVDPLLGGNAALRDLLDAAHERGMRVVLDGVFNHASRGFWPFHHILENGGDSPYLDWFIVHDWPLRPYSSDAKHPPNYGCWWNLPALPKLNTDNPGVRDYIFGVARHWVEFGIDGWRLDVPYEIDDVAFWQEFRQVVKGANPDAYICGEIWQEAQRWLQGDQFDAVMNYIFMSAALSFCGGTSLNPAYQHELLTLEPLDAAGFAAEIDRMHGLYDWEVTQVQLNLLDSHDTPRALWILREDDAARRLCVLLQMTLPGAPCIYYGDEVGLSAGDDPYCREAFPWQDAESWDRELLDFYQRAIALRHQHPVLRSGRYEPLYATGQVYAFRRALDGQEAVVIINSSTEQASAAMTADKPMSPGLRQVWPLEGRDDDAAVSISANQLAVTVPPQSAVVLAS